VQVDADMVLDPDCFERLRQAMDDDVGMAVGALRDPLLGPIAGVKIRLGDTPGAWGAAAFRSASPAGSATTRCHAT
jgi:hypothetical protein